LPISRCGPAFICCSKNSSKKLFNGESSGMPGISSDCGAITCEIEILTTAGESCSASSAKLPEARLASIGKAKRRADREAEKTRLLQRMITLPLPAFDISSPSWPGQSDRGTLFLCFFLIMDERGALVSRERARRHRHQARAPRARPCAATDPIFQ